MAKTLTCAICGKEITKGFFGGNATDLEIAQFVSLDVCEECHKEYSVGAAVHKERFSAKLTNYKCLNRAKPGKEEIAKFYKKYLSEFDAFRERNSGEADYEGWFFTSNNKGEFGVSEGKLGFLNTNFSRNSKIENFQNDIIADFGFTKDDISCIEYRLTKSDFNGLFHKVYDLEIKLCNIKEISYKPCIVISIVEGGGFGLGYKHFANKHALEYLEDFKKRIGSDLPIVKVRSFR